MKTINDLKKCSTIEEVDELRRNCSQLMKEEKWSADDKQNLVDLIAAKKKSIREAANKVEEVVEEETETVSQKEVVIEIAKKRAEKEAAEEATA